jgi:hypothetical protein
MTATAVTSLGEVTEVPEKARRRRYTVESKLQIVKDGDRRRPYDPDLAASNARRHPKSPLAGPEA